MIASARPVFDRDYFNAKYDDWLKHRSKLRRYAILLASTLSAEITVLGRSAQEGSKSALTGQAEFPTYYDSFAESRWYVGVTARFVGLDIFCLTSVVIKSGLQESDFVTNSHVSESVMATHRIEPDSPQRRRMGRPAKPEENARRNRVVTLVTDAELKKLKTIAEAENRSLSAVVHQILKNHLSLQD